MPGVGMSCPARAGGWPRRQLPAGMPLTPRLDHHGRGQDHIPQPGEGGYEYQHARGRRIMPGRAVPLPFGGLAALPRSRR